MAYALAQGVSAIHPARERAVLTVAISILLHVMVVWAVLSLLVARTLPVPDEALTIEFAPQAAIPAPAAPSVAPDRPEALPERPRSELAPLKPDTTDKSPNTAEPGSGSAAGPAAAGEPISPPAPPVAAPRPTYRAPISFPRRAEAAERDGIAVVEVLIAAGGAVSDIRVVSESPEGYGFGEAAADSVSQWRFETATPGVYRVTVRFTLQ